MEKYSEIAAIEKELDGKRPQGDAMSLHALVVEFDAAADRYAERRELPEGMPDNVAHAIGSVYRACARRLNDALAGGGEAVARFRVINRGPVAPDMEFDWLAQPLDIGSNEWTQLFTNPAGAVQDAVLLSWLSDMDNAASIGVYGDVRNLRQRISAALNPGGSRE